MLVITDCGGGASGEHVGALAGELIERDGRLVEVSGALVDELHATLAAGDEALHDVDAGPVCPMWLRDATVLAWVPTRATVEHVERDPRPAPRLLRTRPGVIY